MSVLSLLIEKEECRNRNMISKYSKELASLPKGSINTKNKNGKNYYYLVFRDGQKVISRYIGKDENQVAEIKEQLARRKQVQEILKKLEQERKQILKMEAIV